MKRAFSDMPAATPEAIIQRLDWCAEVLEGREELFNGLAAMHEVALNVHKLSRSIHHAASRAAQRSKLPLEDFFIPAAPPPIEVEHERTIAEVEEVSEA